MRDQRLVALAHRRHFRIDAFEQLLLRVAPADARGERLTHRAVSSGAGERLVELEHMRAFGVLRLARRIANR